MLAELLITMTLRPLGKFVPFLGVFDINDIRKTFIYLARSHYEVMFQSTIISLRIMIERQCIAQSLEEAWIM